MVYIYIKVKENDPIYDIFLEIYPDILAFDISRNITNGISMVSREAHTEDSNLRISDSVLLTIVEKISENNSEGVFTCGFYEKISLLCGALNKKYISWITSPLDGDVYSFSVKNGWNTVYVAVPELYSKYKKLGTENIHYMPLGYDFEPRPNVTPYFCNSEESDNGTIFYVDGLNMSPNLSTKLSELKDATKGYLSAVTEAVRGNLELNVCEDDFPQYIKNDLEEKYPYIKNSIASKADYYNDQFFYPEIDASIGYIYVHYMISVKALRTITFAMYKELPYTNKELSRISAEDLKVHGYQALSTYSIVVYFSKFSDKGMITEELWNILASGAFVLCSYNTDLAILGDDGPVTFKNLYDMECKLHKYLKNPNERQRIASRVQKKVLECGNIKDRISTIVESIES